MNRAEKVEVAKGLKEKFKKAGIAVFADYKGLTATEADLYRKEIRSVGGEVKVIKNNLCHFMAEDGALGESAKEIAEHLAGPTMVTFIYGDPASAAKKIHKFAKENEAFELKDSLMGQKKLHVTEIEQLASLPSREQLLGMLLSVMSGPARGLVTVMSGVSRNLVNVLSAIEKKKAEGGN